MNKQQCLDLLNLANDEAIKGVGNGDGGPFGSVITNQRGEVVATGHNCVLVNNDPTAHGEIVTIRKACAKLATYDLTGYTLFTNAEPCPMCATAIVWANIEMVYFANTVEQTNALGFRDGALYAYLNGQMSDGFAQKIHLPLLAATKLFEQYHNDNQALY